MIPAVMKTSEIPRFIPVPNRLPISSTPLQVVMNGMKMSCARGQIRNAVIGDAAPSMLCANPITLPSLSYGTTFCMIVFSAASTNGKSVIRTSIPRANRIIDAWTVKKIHDVRVMMLMRNIVLTGDLPSQYFAMNIPPPIKPRLINPNSIPRICTDISESPYASISDMNTPPRKLLNVVKRMRPTSPGIAFTILTVPFMSIFFGAGAASSCGCELTGAVSGRRTKSICRSTSAVTPIAMMIAHPIPKNHIANQLATEVNANDTPFIVPIFPFAFACSSSGKSIGTVVESAM